MEIIINDEKVIQKNVKVKEVFEDVSLGKMCTAIRNDFEDSVREGWVGTSPEELGYDWTSYMGDIQLQKQAIDYAIYASELSLHDFLQEFIDYADVYYHEYERFMEQVRSGNIKIVSSKSLTW